MILKGIEVGNPEIGLLFKLLLIDEIVAIKNFTNRIETYSYKDLKELDELYMINNKANIEIDNNPLQV